MRNRPMNVVYIHSHDTGRYIQPYGYDVPTPNMQRLAEQGVLFRQAFNSPTCSPSRACLLTGQSAHVTACWPGPPRLQSPRLRSHRPYPEQRGYTTTLCGTQHVPTTPDCSATTASSRPTSSVSGYDTAAARRRRGRLPCESPGGALFPHRRLLRDPSRLSRAGTRRKTPGTHDHPHPCPTRPETRDDMASFRPLPACSTSTSGGCWTRLTKTAGGEHPGHLHHRPRLRLPGHEMHPHRSRHRRLAHPARTGRLQGGKVSDAMVSHIDLFPTVCELIDIDTPEWLQGKSMLPLVQDNDEGSRRKSTRRSLERSTTMRPISRSGLYAHRAGSISVTTASV